MLKYVIHDHRDGVLLFRDGWSTWEYHAGYLAANKRVMCDAKTKPYSVETKNGISKHNIKPTYLKLVNPKKNADMTFGFEVDPVHMRIMQEIRNTNQRLLQYGKSAFWLEDNWYV